MIVVVLGFVVVGFFFLIYIYKNYIYSSECICVVQFPILFGVSPLENAIRFHQWMSALTCYVTSSSYQNGMICDLWWIVAFYARMHVFAQLIFKNNWWGHEAEVKWTNVGGLINLGCTASVAAKGLGSFWGEWKWKGRKGKWAVHLLRRLSY